MNVCTCLNIVRFVSKDRWFRPNRRSRIEIFPRNDSAEAAVGSRCVVGSQRSSGMCLQSHHTEIGSY